MNIQSLYNFTIAAKHLSFTKAAEECYIAQSAISRQIAAIEEELGITLFIRSKVKMQLTPAGEAFYKEVQDILQRYNSAVFQARDIDSGYSETLSIGFGLFDTQIVKDYVKRFSKQYSNVSVILNQYPYDTLIQNIKENKCDVAFCPSNRVEQLKGVNIIKVISYCQSIAVSNNNILSHKTEVTSNDLDNQVFINPAENSYMHPIIFDMFCAGKAISPKKIVSANTLDAILTMVEADFGISIVPEYLSGATPYNISVIPINIEKYRRQEHVAVSLTSNKNKSTKDFMKMIGEHVRADNSTGIEKNVIHS